MVKNPIVFICYSPQQADLKQFIENLLQDMGFTCLALEQDQHASIEAARSLIQRADCFTGLLTPDKRTEDGLYVCLETTNIQLGLGFNAKIPMQLFAFDHVDTSNIVFPLSSQIVKMQRFKTKFGMSLLFDAQNIRLLFRSLLNFHRQVVSSSSLVTDIS